MILKLVSNMNIIQIFPVKQLEIFDSMLFYLTEDNVKTTKNLEEFKSVEFIDLKQILYKKN